jgi:hypothetical protein
VKAKLIGIAILVVYGIIRMPLEADFERRQKELHFHGAVFSVSMRQQVGQLGFVAALSGFRALVADILWIEAHSAWERTEWGRMKVLFDTITALQPRNITFWDVASWHMAFNASVAARQDESVPREAMRLRAERQYWSMGEDFLLRGAANNPDRAILFERLGLLYREKFKDPVKAHWAYEEAQKRPDALGYVHRFAAYELAKIPGKEQEAYNLLKSLYDRGEEERLPTLERLIRELEQKLNVPSSQRIYSPSPQNN